MAADHVTAQPRALGRLAHALMLADAQRPVEDTTGLLLRAWWRVATDPTPATFRAWGRRARPAWIAASLLVGSALRGVSDAINAFHVADIGLDLNPQGRYLTHPTVALMVARTVATTLAMIPITLAVLLALAMVTRRRGVGGLRARWDALALPWALAQPALGLALLVNSTCTLGVAAVLQAMHATPPGPLAALALDFLSFPLLLVWAAVLLGYTVIVLLSAVWSVAPEPPRGTGWLAADVYLTVGLLVGLAFTFAAQALGIPGPLFG